MFGNTIDLSNLENLDKKHISFQEFLELLNNVQVRTSSYFQQTELQNAEAETLLISIISRKKDLLKFSSFFVEG